MKINTREEVMSILISFYSNMTLNYCTPYKVASQCYYRGLILSSREDIVFYDELYNKLVELKSRSNTFTMQELVNGAVLRLEKVEDELTTIRSKWWYRLFIKPFNKNDNK